MPTQHNKKSQHTVAKAAVAQIQKLDRSALNNIVMGVDSTKSEFKKVIRKRNRRSKLDPHFHRITAFLHAKACAVEAGKGTSKFSLNCLSNHLRHKLGIQVSKSALSRFIARHPDLKAFLK